MLDKPSPQQGIAVPSAELKILIDRVTALMAGAGTNAKQLSRRAGLGNTAVYDIVNGKNKRPAVYVVKAIAKAIGCDLAYLLGDQDVPILDMVSTSVAKIPVIGVAEAGAFRKMVEFDQDISELPTILANKSVLYPKAKHFALLVRGDSMNAARPMPIIEGMHILCVDVTDAGLEIESGKIYALRRTTDSGQTFECTVKRAMVFRDRYEFSPESTNPRHDRFVIPRGAGRGDDTGAEIRAIGLVYGFYFSLETAA